MKRIGVSVVLCSALAMGMEGTETKDLIADFGNNGGSDGKHYTATKGNGGSGESVEFLGVLESPAGENGVSYDKDWTGNDTSLHLKTDDLIFTFKATPNGQQKLEETTNYNNLLVKDDFKLTAESGVSKVTIKNGDNGTTLGRTENKLTSITFGADSQNKKITIGEGITLGLVDFTKVIVSGHVMVGKGSSFSTGEKATLDITGGITLQEGASLLTKSTINNNGVITMLDGSSIQAKDKLTIGTTNDPAPKPDAFGSLIYVKGNATIYAGNGTTQPPNPTLTIEGQTIETTEGKTLTLSSSKPTEGDLSTSGGSLILGGVGPSLVLGGENSALTLGDKTKTTTFKGGNLKLEGFTELQTKDVVFKDVKIEATSLTSLKNTKLSLTNTTLTTTNDLAITKENGSSSFILSGNNSITAKKSTDQARNGGGNITFNGTGVTHSFSGEGRLDLNADVAITFGTTSSTAEVALLQVQGDKNAVAIGLNAPTIKFENLKASNLTLEIFGTNTKIQNKNLELDNTTLKAYEKGSLQNLIIENDNGSSGANIKITDTKNATIAGRDISIFGQTIKVGNGEKGRAGATTLTLNANDGKGILILGKSTPTDKQSQNNGANKVSIIADNENGKVGIQGNTGGSPTSELILKASEVQYGELELKDLKITAQASSPSAGLTFAGSDKDAKLTLDATNGGKVEITAGADKNYQALTFGVKSTTENKGFQSNVEVKKDATLKASTISFISQKVNFANGASSGGGKNLELYALGLSGEEQSGSFSFVDTEFGTASTMHALEQKTGQLEIKLVTNNGATLFASGLVLDGVNLTSYKANGTGEQGRTLSTKTSLDLSASETSNDPADTEKRTPSLTALGQVKIEAMGIYSGVKPKKDPLTGQDGGAKEEKVRGIGMDIQIGNSTKTGQLVIKDIAPVANGVSAGGSVSADPVFVIGGVLTIDNTKGSGAGVVGTTSTGTETSSSTMPPSTLEIQMGADKTTDSTLEIEMGTASSGGSGGRADGEPYKLSTQTLGLQIDGGIVAIGKDNSGSLNNVGNGTNGITLKAKSFTFGKPVDENAPNDKNPNDFSLKVYTTTLTLDTKQEGVIEIKGLTYLEGTATTQAELKTKKTNGSSQGTSVFSTTSATTAGLKLHDITAKGKASITDKLSFVDSNIKVIGLGGSDTTLTLTDNTTLTLTDTTSKPTAKPTGIAEAQNIPITGIANLDFENGSLKFLSQNGTAAGAEMMANGGTASEVILNSEATLTSSGTSSLEVKSLKAQENKDDKENKGVYTLKITDGTFSLKEETAGNAIGDIYLGEEKEKKGGNLILVKTSNSSGFQKNSKTGDERNAYTLKGNITTFGSSSLEASSFDLMQGANKEGEEEKLYQISVSSGEFALIKKATPTKTLSTETDYKLKSAITLQDGVLAFYSGSQTSKSLASATFDTATRIDSSGNSSISGSDLVFQGNTINIRSGSLQIYGSTRGVTAGDVFVGDSAQFKVYNQDLHSNPMTLRSLYIIDNKSVTFGANVGYVSESEPLGKGNFGTITAYSVEFAGDSTKESKLININVNGSPKTREANDDSLFALKEKTYVLIDTRGGIKKKSSQAGGTATGANSVNITLEDIATSTGGFSTLSLTPKLIEDESKTTVKQLVLDLSVSQTTAKEILESVQNSEAKGQMQDLLSQGNNESIIDSVLQSKDNPLKVGLSMYISEGNVGVVSTTLGYINQTFENFSKSIYVSNEILKELRMIRASNFESRMVQGGNPFGAKAELASLLQEASKQRYASSELSLFVGGEEKKTGVGTVWASYDGAINVGSAQKSSVNGLSAGYDLLLGDNKEYLLGVFASYGYGAYSTSTLQDTSHNIGLGLYTRMFFGPNEVDLALAQTIGLNKLQTQVGPQSSIPASYLNQTLNYNFYTTELQAKYGYMFKVGSEENPYYFKPFGGVNFLFAYNGESSGDGEASIGMSGITNFRLEITFGLEMRKYLNANTYFYLLPLLEKSLFNDGSDIKVGFDNIYTTAYTIPRDNSVNLGIYAGGQGNVTNQLSIMGGAGFKASVDQKDILTNWNVGLKYKF